MRDQQSAFQEVNLPKTVIFGAENSSSKLLENRCNNFKPFVKGPSEVAGIIGELKIRFDPNTTRDDFKVSLRVYDNYGDSY